MKREKETGLPMPNASRRRHNPPKAHCLRKENVRHACLHFPSRAKAELAAASVINSYHSFICAETIRGDSFRSVIPSNASFSATRSRLSSVGQQAGVPDTSEWRLHIVRGDPVSTPRYDSLDGASPNTNSCPGGGRRSGSVNVLRGRGVRHGPSRASTLDCTHFSASSCHHQRLAALSFPSFAPT